MAKYLNSMGIELFGIIMHWMNNVVEVLMDGWAQKHNVKEV